MKKKRISEVLNNNSQKKVTATEMDFLLCRRNCRITCIDRIMNGEIRQRMKFEKDIPNYIVEKHLIWHGYVKTDPDQ